MPYVLMYRACEEIAEVTTLRVAGQARVRCADNEWGWCDVADLIRLGLLPAEKPVPENGGM